MQLPMIIENFSGTYFFLSNFYPHKITVPWGTFKSVEAAFQAAKCADRSEIPAFEALHPDEARRKGRQVKLVDNWECMKDGVMLVCLSAKFADPILRGWLKNTRPHILIEGNDWNDTYWGVCRGVGTNMLGNLLMLVRGDYD